VRASGTHIKDIATRQRVCRTGNMFTTHTGTPYNGYSLADAPNSSDGQGNPGLYGPNAPPPSGGFVPSVYNRSLENVTNDIPSRYYQVSQNEHVSRDFRIGDLVFVPVAREFPGDTKQDYQVRGRRATGKTNTPLMTLHDANAEIRRLARLRDSDNHWTTDPLMVSRWMVPLGVVIGVDVALGAASKRVRGVNVCVSRRAQMTNTFMIPPTGVTPSNTDVVGIQYKLVQVKLEVDVSVKVVQMLTVLVGGNDFVDISGIDLTMDASHEVPRAIQCKYERPTHSIDESDCVFVLLGRILHSPPRYPTLMESAKSCLTRDPNIRPSTIEIVLGNL